MLIEKRNKCPWRNEPHMNLAYAIYTDGDYCYSCNRGSFKSRDWMLDRNVLCINEDIVFPTGTSNNIKEFSTKTLAWLYKYYVYDSLIKKYSIFHCPYNYFQTSSGIVYEGESLIFPIIINNSIIAYQQRFFPNKNFYSKNTNYHIFDCGNHHTNTVVIVEDFISAIRVGEMENCIWLQGTDLSNSVLNYIIKNYFNIIIWLDGDKPGQEAAKRIENKLRKRWENLYWFNAFAVREQRTIRNIITENDPKSYSNYEIREIING